MTNVYMTVGRRFGQWSCDVREGGDVQDRVTCMDAVGCRMCWRGGCVGCVGMEDVLACYEWRGSQWEGGNR